MGRAKQRMERISNAKNRYATFQKRKKGMMKKAYELQTLCDVGVCLIVYGPATDEHPNPLAAEIWPENPDTIHHLIDSYRNQAPEERGNRTKTLSNVFTDRNHKIEHSLVKLRKKNDEAAYSTWDDRYSNWPVEELKLFDVTLEGKIQDAKARIAAMKASSLTQITQNPSCLVQGMVGTRNVEELHEQNKPISMLNPLHESNAFHYPSNHEIQQGFQIVDANLMVNPLMVMPMNYGNLYSTIQLGGASSSRFMCNLPPERPSYGYDSLMPAGMLEYMTYNSNPLPVGYCNPNVETMSSYLPSFKMGCDSSLMDKN